MAAVTITGTLTLVEVRREKATDWNYTHKYSPMSEHYDHFLNCCLTDATGRRFYFNSPKVAQRVTSGGNCAIVTYAVEGEASKWFAETGTEGSRVATAERINTNGIRPLVAVGDTLTVRASVKAVKPGYTALNRVKMGKAAVPA